MAATKSYITGEGARRSRGKDPNKPTKGIGRIGRHCSRTHRANAAVTAYSEARVGALRSPFGRLGEVPVPGTVSVPALEGIKRGRQRGPRSWISERASRIKTPARQRRELPD